MTKQETKTWRRVITAVEAELRPHSRKVTGGRKPTLARLCSPMRVIGRTLEQFKNGSNVSWHEILCSKTTRTKDKNIVARFQVLKYLSTWYDQ